MPPVRRARRADPTGAGSPYPDGWLSSYRHHHRRRRRRPDDDDDVSGGGATTLPDDVLCGIFSRVSGLAAAARCAATCRRWGRVVAARAAPICRALPPPPPPPPGGGFFPHLAVGVFLQHQERRRRGRAAARLRFVPTAAFASRLVLSPAPPFAAASFDDARPVASRNGRVVLRLRRDARGGGGGLALCVWNTMTGDMSMLPALSGEEFPGNDLACAILTGDDDLDGGVPPPPPGFFRLLLVYSRRGSTALRCYSSDTGSWGVEGRKPGAKIAGHVLRQLGPAVVLRGGVAYWPTHSAALGVRLGSAAAGTMDVCTVPYRFMRCPLDEHLMGVSGDGKRLSFVDIGRGRWRSWPMAFPILPAAQDRMVMRWIAPRFLPPYLLTRMPVPAISILEKVYLALKYWWSSTPPSQL